MSLNLKRTYDDEFSFFKIKVQEIAEIEDLDFTKTTTYDECFKKVPKTYTKKNATREFMTFVESSIKNEEHNLKVEKRKEEKSKRSLI
jgi:hypothetical protein